MQLVNGFLSTIDNERRRNDSRQLVKLMQDATDAAPVMWGNIIGFGKHHYKYESGREGDTMAVGFAPRKNALVVYGIIFYEQSTGDMDKLGKVKLGKGCVYINKLSDVDTEVLLQMTAQAYKDRNNA